MELPSNGDTFESKCKEAAISTKYFTKKLNPKDGICTSRNKAAYIKTELKPHSRNKYTCI